MPLVPRQLVDKAPVLLRRIACGFFALLCLKAQAAYEVGATEILREIYALSREIRSLEHVLDSREILLESEQKYYLPKVNVAAEYNQFDGQRPPPLEKDSELKFALTANLFSDVTDERIGSAASNRMSAYLQLVRRKSELYYTVMEQLIKIERNRAFIRESEAVRAQLDDYLAQIERSVEAGVSPRSYLRESRLIQVRFQDVVSNAKSNIDRYFNELSLSTGYQVSNKNAVGINSANVFIALNHEPAFEPQVVLKNNLDILARQYEIEALRESASVQHERLKVSMFSDVNMGLIETERNEFLNVRETTVAGIRVEYNLFDFQRESLKKSAFKTYLSERQLLDDQIDKVFVQVTELRDRYENVRKKRLNLEDQLEISKSLLEAQEREILVDRIRFIDLMKSLSDRIQTQVTFLNNDISLIETVFEYQGLVNSGFVQ